MIFNTCEIHRQVWSNIFLLLGAHLTWFTFSLLSVFIHISHEETGHVTKSDNFCNFLCPRDILEIPFFGGGGGTNNAYVMSEAKTRKRNVSK